MEASLSVITPVVRSVISRAVTRGELRQLPSVHSGEARQQAHTDFHYLLETRKRALVSGEMAELEGAVEACLRAIYSTSQREVWWHAMQEAESPGFSPATFRTLEAARRATGVTPSWMHPLRKIADAKDLRRVAELHTSGKIRTVRQRWRHFWLPTPIRFHDLASYGAKLQQIFVWLLVVTFPLSLLIAGVVRHLTLRQEDKRAIEDWQRWQMGKERRYLCYRKRDYRWGMPYRPQHPAESIPAASFTPIDLVSWPPLPPTPITAPQGTEK